jgi:YidC/Oxa1 family membrane protein insertase
VTVFAGILSPIEEPLTSILEWLHGSMGLSWAWAIVVLVVMVRIVLVPLTIKQVRSMQKLQQHAPELKAIQEKYKSDKQRQQEEIMKFYRENKVNPAASCLPILFQIPIFIALFYVLRDFEKEVFPKYSGSDLGFLNGLVPNITTNVNDHWSGWLLLAIYVGSQLTSFLLMSTAVQSRAQKILFMVLPVAFIPFIINFPVGLMIYWVTTNLWTTGQGLVTRRMIPRTPVELPKRTSRTPPKDDDESGNGARRKPTPKPSSPARAKPKAASGAKPKPAGAKPKPAAGGEQRPVRRRKKKGARPRR